MKNIYIGEEMGFFKPHREAFEYVLRDLGAANSEVLMVGDSIEDDIHGAERAGIKAVLIDRRNRYSAYTGTRIASLSQLIKLPSVGAISDSQPSFKTEFFLQNSVFQTKQ